MPDPQDAAALLPTPGALTQDEIDQRVFDLYDEYCHGRIDRRTFLQRAAVVTAGGLAMAQALLPRYVQAQTVSFTDERIKPSYVTFPRPAAPPAPCAATSCSPAARGLSRWYW
ncbi:twin-arginine translocation signal domain-containing protein [Pseudoroseomonas wenyumeiae]